ncbi:protein of unknown function DUF896 [Ruminiclostridium papyrosolvens DSM 2782]|uniref:UPF0291 protein Cpap_1566 n=1 Tax=Ruminiclostridium papyrosolvens DSM 2782 TaxID=588581 RepID=F1TEK7_9FIRM|nr:DUF896 domain-containing protein [Ruminiclostridium papyrosolvens]EGD47173.1 protein of unknown function DUF896 [Ruminiclostridium papyrosolvens DSM 2782]WES36213.1 DUF896 domain-containing protein [Ruminiclostridium papyrosolvens DSM 2782]
MEKSRIERLNELAKKAKSGSLTSSELAERDKLRKEYIEAFRSNLKATLDNTVIVDADGNRRSLRKDN